MNVCAVSQSDHVVTLSGMTAPGAPVLSDDGVLEVPLIDDLPEGQRLRFRAGVQTIKLAYRGPFLEGVQPFLRIIVDRQTGRFRILRTA
jgi:hypothetical protein